MLHSKFTKSRNKDSVTPECRNPCCPRKKGKDIYPTTAPPSQAAEASVLPSCQQHFFIRPPSLLALLYFQNKHLGQAGSLCSAASMEHSVLELTLMLQRLNLKSNPSSKRSVSVRGENRKCLELAAFPTAGVEQSRGSHQQLQCNRTILEAVKSYIAGSPLPPNMYQERTKAS